MSKIKIPKLAIDFISRINHASYCKRENLAMFQQHRFVAEMTGTSFMRAAREDPETIIGSSTQHLSLWSDRWLYSLRLRQMVVNAWRERVPGRSREQNPPAPTPPPSKSEPLSRNCSYNCTKVNACYCCCQPARTAALSSNRQTNAFVRMSANALLGFRDKRYIRI